MPMIASLHCDEVPVDGASSWCCILSSSRWLTNRVAISNLYISLCQHEQQVTAWARSAQMML